EYDVVLIVGLDDAQSANLHKQAKAARCLVNVEDNKDYCDFFFQSFVKRGKLLISVSTGGSSPATAKIVRDKIEETFPPEWEDYMDNIAQKRIEWKAAGKTYDEVNELTKEYMKPYTT
ncbi:MAG: NAD(P)-dependent oxidoreductase, partial [Rickettsiales bacterium]